MEVMLKKIRMLISRMLGVIKCREARIWNLAIKSYLSDREYQHYISQMSIRQPEPSTGKIPGFPNVFCVGVQKSATSFLYSILRCHPKVSANPKDMSMLERLNDTGSLSEFEQLAKNVKAHKPIIAHFDVGFMFHGEAGIETIKKSLCSSPRIIICLRDPIARMISEYRMRIRSVRAPNGPFVENHDFLEAIDMEAERSQQGYADYINYFAYIERGKYAKRIKSYIEAFGEENVHIVIMESDLREKRSISVAKLFNFLSIFDESAFKLSLLDHEEFHNVSSAPTKMDLTLYTHQRRKVCNPASFEDIKFENIRSATIHSNNKNQLTMSRNNPSIEFLQSAINLQRRLSYSPSMAERIELYKKHFLEDVEELEKLLGRDLSIWYKDYDIKSLCSRKNPSPTLEAAPYE